MSFLEQQKFEFVSSAPGLSGDTFGVVKFKGVEAISMPYEFDVTLVSDNRDVTPEAILPYPARFTISRDKGAGDVHFNGILAEFEEIREFGGYIFYRAHLVPRLWWLNLTYHNQVCLDSGVDEILENCLKDGGLFPGRDFEIRLRRKPPKFEYVCQYGETHFNFISRWVEREGIYYFFEQTPDGEKVIFTDTLLAHTDLLQGANLTYAPPSGLESSRIDEAILSFTCRRRMLPKKVFLKDYNYEKPSLGIEGSAVVDQNGRGENYFYGEHFPSPEEGDRLAKIMAEALLCRQSCFYGESSVPFMRPGYRFQLKEHYRAENNRKYLIAEVTHEGHQTGYLISGIRTALAATEEKMAYGNQFTAIYSDLQFRPERKAAKPKISGTLHANVDAEGAGEYAELDDQGRYKVRLPFDVSKDHPDGKASAYIRMMQPYAGSVEGMHFPLRKGAEVLLTFIGGDPDRPVIAGAVPNTNSASPVTSANQTESVIKTGSNNRIRMEDLAGSQRIILETPTADTWFRMGAPNDPPPPVAPLQTVKDSDPTKGIKIFTTGTLVEESQDNQDVILDDPDFATRAFVMAEAAYTQINAEITAEQTRLQEEYDIITDPGKKAAKLGEMLTTAQIAAIIAALRNSGAATRAAFVQHVNSTYSAGNKAYVRNIILRNIEDQNARKRKVSIDGEQIITTADSHKIQAVDESLKISMSEGGIILDAGDNNVTINCQHFYLNNQKEDNITYGEDFAEHHGSSTELFYGYSKEEFHGTKDELHIGDIHSAHFGGAAEAFAGGKVEWNGAESLEFFTGFKQEFSLAETFELYFGAKQEVMLSPLFNLDIYLGAKIELFLGLKLGFTLLSADKTLVNLTEDEVKVKGGKLEVGGKTISIDNNQFKMIA